MSKYICTDGSAEIEIDAVDEQAAAEQYVANGEYPTSETTWVDVYVREPGEKEALPYTVQIDPDEPDCVSGQEHEWSAEAYEVVAGRPHTIGSGGGVLVSELCPHCGRVRVTDTWAQRRDTGEEGLERVTYREPPENYQAWLDARVTEYARVVVEEMTAEDRANFAADSAGWRRGLDARPIYSDRDATVYAGEAIEDMMYEVAQLAETADEEV